MCSSGYTSPLRAVLGASPHGAPEYGTDEPNEEAPWVARAELAPWAAALGEYATIDLTPSADDGMGSQIRATQPPRSPCSAAPLVQGTRCDERFARWEHLHKALMEHGERECTLSPRCLRYSLTAFYRLRASPRDDLGQQCGFSSSFTLDTHPGYLHPYALPSSAHTCASVQ